METKEQNKTFLDYTRVIFDKLWVVVSLFILVEVLVFAQNMIMSPKYEASAKLLILGAKERGIPLSRELFSWKGTIDIARSHSEMIKSEKIIRDVVELLKLDTRKKPRDMKGIIEDIAEFLSDRYTDFEAWLVTTIFRGEYKRPHKPSQFEKTVDKIKRRQFIKVQLLPDTDIIQVKAIDYEPQMAAKMANAAAMIYIIHDMEEQLQDLTRTYKEKHPKIVELMNNINESSQKLASGLDYKEIEINMPSNIKIGEPAMPPLKPVAPKKLLNLLVGALLSIVCGIFLVFVIDYFDQTIKTPDDAEGYLGIPFLGSAPKLAKSDMKKGISLDSKENFISLCSEIYARIKKEGLKNILITSAVPSEGKSLLAYNLALVLSRDRRLNVVLADLNFKNPTVHKLANVANENGMQQLLEGKVAVEAAFKKNSQDKFSVIPGGSNVKGSSLFFDKKDMKNILDLLGNKTDVVIIDGASLRDSPDIISFAQITDSVLLAVRASTTRRFAVQRFKNILAQYNVRFIGSALTLREYKIPAYIYIRM